MVYWEQGKIPFVALVKRVLWKGSSEPVIGWMVSYTSVKVLHEIKFSRDSILNLVQRNRSALFAPSLITSHSTHATNVKSLLRFFPWTP